MIYKIQEKKVSKGKYGQLSVFCYLRSNTIHNGKTAEESGL